MARNKKKSVQANNYAMEANSKQAENNLAAASTDKRNFKGNAPNSPSTG